MSPFILIGIMALALPATDPISGFPAFREVFDEHAPYVWRVLRRLGVRLSDIDDACQEVFVVVFRKAATFDGSSSLRTWIYGICLRVASDFRRRAHLHREQLTEAPPDTGSSAAGQEDRRAALEALDRVLSCLDDDKRDVFVLYEIEQLSMKEVAQAVECPLQTAYSRLHAARDKVALLAQELHPGRLP